MDYTKLRLVRCHKLWENLKHGVPPPITGTADREGTRTFVKPDVVV